MKFKKIYAFAFVASLSVCVANSQTVVKKSGTVKSKSTNSKSRPVTKKNTSASNLVILKNSKDSLSYALGTDIARSLKTAGFDLDTKMLFEGLSSSYKGNSVLINEDKSSELIQAAAVRAKEQKNAELRKPGEEFLAKNKQKPNIIVTEDGVQYEVLIQGQGAQPTVSDEVVVHYLGTLPNGEKFDSTYDRNEPLSLSLQSVIRGWQLGVPLMRVGSKYRFYIPYNLAYGERGSGPKIPPFTPLIFEVELLDVKGKEVE